MAQAPESSRPDCINATINYVEPDATIMRRFICTGAEVNTFGFRDQTVPIHNGRLCRDRFTMDSAGFQLLDHKSAVRDFLDEDEVGAIYPQEVIDLVKEVTGASAVFVSNWNLRSTDPLEVADLKAQGRRDRTGRMQPPGFQVHIDFYPDAAEKTARGIYERNAPDGPGYHRFISMSLWRTFSTPPQDQPLAMCEFASVRDNEGLRNALVFCDEIPDDATMRAPMENEDQLTAATLFKYNPEHRWWFFPDMMRDEAVLFKFHDSDQSVAWRVPHTAFRDSSIAHPRIRQSIETRVTAFFEN